MSNQQPEVKEILTSLSVSGLSIKKCKVIEIRHMYITDVDVEESEVDGDD